jgi:chromate transporter
LIALTAAVMFGFGINPMLAILTAGLFGLGLYARQTFATADADASEEPYSLKPLWFVLLFTLLALVLMFLFQRRLFELAFLMLRIDLFAFGGGFSSLPLMFNEVVHVRAWMDSLTFLNGIALGQITPGPIVITATFIGYLRDGLSGGVTATMFIFLPSFLLLVGTVPYYKRLRSSPYFNRALQGILYSFVGLLLSVTIRFALDVPWDLPRVFLTGMTFTALLFRAPLPWTVLIGTIVSLVIL